MDKTTQLLPKRNLLEGVVVDLMLYVSNSISRERGHILVVYMSEGKGYKWLHYGTWSITVGNRDDITIDIEQGLTHGHELIYVESMPHYIMILVWRLTAEKLPGVRSISQGEDEA